MATTRIMPLHTGKGRDAGTAISDIIDYVKNPEKTDGGRLITSFQCDSRTADAEFLFSKRQYKNHHQQDAGNPNPHSPARSIPTLPGRYDAFPHLASGR